ncbi:MAG: TerB family tellurite resistance protein [Phycisphaerae bacterium]|nr:TerB family tellurite resistance protein [Phycisphaerae bacterium]
MSKETKRDLRNVLVMALADGKLTEDERGFIHRLREQLGVSKDEFRRLVKQFKEHPKKVTLPRGGPAAQRAIQLMASMAAVDGQVSDPEQRLLDKLAKWAGLKSKAAESAVAAQSSQSIEPDQVSARKVSKLSNAIYANFAAWDERERTEKIAELAGFAEASLEGLLRILESYRTPEGAPDALELRTLVVRQLGKLGDARAAYYLAQQVTIGDMEDEITNAALRCAAAEAFGKIVGKDFSPDRAGVKVAREWWLSFGSRQYTSLAI